MASTLPDNPSLDRLRAQARALQRDLRSGEQRAVAVVRAHHPSAGVALERFALHDAQLTVARSYGFSGWPALVGYLNIAVDLAVDPSTVDEHAIGTADRVCALASLRYYHTDAPPRWRAAAELIAANPDVPQRHIWAAAAAADPAALHGQISLRPELANTAGGPFGWVPLLYLCYSRVPLPHNEDQVLAAASVLLDAGADPNAGYLWRAMATPFTALTGVFGEGEQGPGRQPRHRFASALAGLLLTRGAHPVDHQTLYNRMFRPDDSHLELLFQHGLAEAGPSPWERRLGEAIETRDQMWRRQIDWAAGHGFADRLDLLARDDDGATALHHAAWSGDLGLIRQLLDEGADPDAVDLRHGATPLGWAEHAYQAEAAELLRRHRGRRES